MNQHIVIVEDEIKLAKLLQDYLQQASATTTIVSDGNQVIPSLEKHKTDLILLDLMLPNKDGLTLCREIRQSTEFTDIPIIITTAKVDEIDRLLGLEIGADDYICKPYSPREVVARVKAVLRRHTNNQPQAPNTLLVLEHEKMKATICGHDLQLTAIEYALLKLMNDKPGKIFSRAQLMDAMYKDYRVVSERTIDSHIKKIRKKITQIDDNIELVQSVYGVGYKIEINF